MENDDKRSYISILVRGVAFLTSSVSLRLIIGFVTQVILARLLAPELFGAVVYVASIALLLNALANLHTDKFVIQFEGDAQRALNVGFTLEVLASVLIFLITVTVLPLVMSVLGNSDLLLYAQILAVSVFYNPLCRPRGMLERELQFDRVSVILVVSQLVASVFAILLALDGSGIFSIIALRIGILFVEVLILWSIASYRPKFEWNSKLVRQQLKFSLPLVGSAFLTFFYYNFDYFLVGQVRGETELGYYWLGFQLGTYALMLRQVSFGVFFPFLSRIDDHDLRKRIFSRLTKATAAGMLLIGVLVLMFAEILISGIFGKDWAPAVLPFQIIFLTVMLRAINSNVGYLLYSLGHTKPEFEATVIFSVLLVPSVTVATLYSGIVGAAVSVFVTQLLVTTYVFQRYIRPLVGEGSRAFFLPYILFAFFVFLLSRVSDLISLGVVELSLITVVLFITAYRLLAWEPFAAIFATYKNYAR